MCEQSLSFITTTKSHVCNGHKFAKNVNNVRFGWDGTGCGYALTWQQLKLPKIVNLWKYSNYENIFCDVSNSWMAVLERKEINFKSNLRACVQICLYAGVICGS